MAWIVFWTAGMIASVHHSLCTFCPMSAAAVPAAVPGVSAATKRSNHASFATGTTSSLLLVCIAKCHSKVSAACASGLQALETLQAAGPQPMANGKRGAEEMEATERPDPKRVSCAL